MSIFFKFLLSFFKKILYLYFFYSCDENKFTLEFYEILAKQKQKQEEEEEDNIEEDDDLAALLSMDRSNPFEVQSEETSKKRKFVPLSAE